jgi:hypothetical protein
VRTELRIAIVRTGRTQRSIAFGAGLDENRLSAIVNGWATPTRQECELLKDELNLNPDTDDDVLFRDSLNAVEARSR